MRYDQQNKTKTKMSNTPNPMNPADMAKMIAMERQYAKEVSAPRSRRVKILRDGDAWKVRFLPVQLGPSGAWYVRSAQHWLNKQPIYCPRRVSADFGGDPEANCPVCDMADTLNQNGDEVISKFGFKLKANLTYITYCLVISIDAGQGGAVEQSWSEILQPWEFLHYNSSYEELCTFQSRASTQKNPWGVFDLINGNDFFATRVKGKGTRLDKQDTAPIFDPKHAKFEQYIDKIYSYIKPVVIKLPDEKSLEAFARKAEAAAYGDHGTVGHGDPETNGHSHRPSTASMRRPSDPDEEPEADPTADQVDVPARPAAATRPAAAAPARTTSVRPAARPAPEPELEPEPENSEADQDQGTAAEPEPDNEEPPPAPAPRATKVAAPRSATTAPSARPATTAPRVASARPASTRVQETVTPEEDPGVAEEAIDPAAAADEPLPDPVAAPTTLNPKLREKLATVAAKK
jgi:hypothetical protein